MGKISKIWHPIVKLRQMLRRRRIQATGSSPPSPLIPAGYVVVYVGRWSRRFVMRVTHLNHPAFQDLLHEAEKHGFSQPGPIFLPCDESVFLQILRQISPIYAIRFAPTDDFDYPASSSCCCFRAGINRSWRRMMPSLSFPATLRNGSGETLEPFSLIQRSEGGRY